MNKTILTNLFSLVVVSMIISSYQSASITSSDNKLDRDIIYDLITSEADAIYERLKSNTNVNSNFYQQQLAENEGLVSSSEVSRPSKRGRRINIFFLLFACFFFIIVIYLNIIF
jgi:hypothetical protein